MEILIQILIVAATLAVVAGVIFIAAVGLQSDPAVAPVGARYPSAPAGERNWYGSAALWCAFGSLLILPLGLAGFVLGAMAVAKTPGDGKGVSAMLLSVLFMFLASLLLMALA